MSVGSGTGRVPERHIRWREQRKLYAFRRGRVEERHIRCQEQRKLYAFRTGRVPERPGPDFHESIGKIAKQIEI